MPLGVPSDLSKPQRQDVHLLALQRFRPEVGMYFGHFSDTESERHLYSRWGDVTRQR